MQRTRLYQSIAASALLFSIQGQAASELYFSEYIEGSSYNKALEITNNTGAPVDLSEYAIHIYFNGSESARTNNTLSGTLADGEVYVEINENIRIGPCVANPEKFIGIGLNYSAHAKETNVKAPKEPIVFFKANSSICGPYDDVCLPKNSSKSETPV